MTSHVLGTVLRAGDKAISKALMEVGKTDNKHVNRQDAYRRYMDPIRKINTSVGVSTYHLPSGVLGKSLGDFSP